MTLGQEIAYYRKEAGLTQVGMARILGITNVYLCYLEHDKHEPSLSMLGRIAKVLGKEIGHEFSERIAWRIRK